ncbi:MAG: hypothetical protein ACREFB_05875 [Stellaceae bacterium]
MRNKLIAAAAAALTAGLLASTAMAAGPRASSEASIPSNPAVTQTSQAGASAIGPRASGGVYIPAGPATTPADQFSAAAMGPRASNHGDTPSH